MHSKQVIFVIHTLAIGGAERHVSAIAEYMIQHDTDVQIVLIDDANVSFPLDSRVRIVCVNQHIKEVPAENLATCRLFRCQKKQTPNLSDKLRLHLASQLFKSKKEYRELEAFLKYEYAMPLREYLLQYPKATVISCMTIPNISTLMALQKLPNRAVFVDFTSPEFEYPPESPFCGIRRAYYPRAQAAMFQTDEERDYYTFLPQVQKFVAPNILRGEEFPPRYEGERRKEIVNFCRLHPVKNIPLLINAFERLHTEYPAYTLGVYGDGDIRPELQQLIDRRGLAACVHLYPADRHIHERVRDAAMFVSSSDREGISNSMLEAMAIGLPTICTDCPAGGARMMITPYEDGLLVPVGDEQAMYAAMKELIENPALAEKLSKNAVHIKERLNIDTIGKQWMNLI